MAVPELILDITHSKIENQNYDSNHMVPYLLSQKRIALLDHYVVCLSVGYDGNQTPEGTSRWPNMLKFG